MPTRPFSQAVHTYLLRGIEFTVSPSSQLIPSATVITLGIPPPVPNAASLFYNTGNHLTFLAILFETTSKSWIARRRRRHRNGGRLAPCLLKEFLKENEEEDGAGQAEDDGDCASDARGKSDPAGHQRSCGQHKKIAGNDTARVTRNVPTVNPGYCLATDSQSSQLGSVTQFCLKRLYVSRIVRSSVGGGSR